MVAQIGPFLDESNCIRGCCHSDKIPLALPKSSLRFHSEIARGSESVVYEASLNGKLAAAKKPKLSTSEDLDRFHNELQLLSKLDHPNIATLLAAHAHPPDYLFLFQHYQNGSLHDALHIREWKPTTQKALLITLQLANSLLYLHNNGVAHRDIKPANVLLDSNWDAYLSDFGLAAYLNDLELSSSKSWRQGGKPTGGFHKRNMVGTVIYMAPEVLQKGVQTEKSDVYGFAITINELFSGVVPYTDRKTEAQAHTVLEMSYTDHQLTNAITSEGLRPVLADKGSGCPPKLAKLIEHCWHRDPEKRPSFKDVVEQVKEICWNYEHNTSAPDTSRICKNLSNHEAMQVPIDWGKIALESNICQPVDESSLSPLDDNMTYLPTLSWGSFSDKGGRQTMEDRHFMLPHVAGAKHTYAFGILDGHRGSEAAEFSCHAIPGFLSTKLLLLPPKALVCAFIETDKSFRQELDAQRNLKKSGQDWHPGCTATTALIVKNRLYIANAGDCRTIMCRKGQAIVLSKDHTATDEKERERIQSLGGQVSWQVDSWRVGAAGLQVTRSIGDDDLKPAVTAEPEIQEIELEETDGFLILATDGLWDVISNEDAVAIVKSTVKDPMLCSKRLVMEAAQRGSRDNITVITVFLHPVSTVERIY